MGKLQEIMEISEFYERDLIIITYLYNKEETVLEKFKLLSMMEKVKLLLFNNNVSLWKEENYTNTPLSLS